MSYRSYSFLVHPSNKLEMTNRAKHRSAILHIKWKMENENWKMSDRAFPRALFPRRAEASFATRANRDRHPVPRDRVYEGCLSR